MSIDKNLGPATAYGYAKTKGYTGTEEEYAELMANIAEAVEIVGDKADKDGTYPDMTVGGVMSSDGSTDSTPYLYRVSGGDVEVGKIEADKIVGGTVAFNQQIRNGNFTNGDVWQKTSDIALSVSSNIGTLTTSEDGDKFVVDTFTDRVPIGHKVLYWVEAKTNAIPSGDSFNVMAVFFYGWASTYKEMRAIDDNWHTYSGVVDIGAPIGQNARYVMMRLCCRKSVITNQYKNVQVYDLTAMFGSAVADMIYNMETANTGSGVAFFRKLFPKDYYEYNTGELMSVEGLQSHDMVGKNLIDLSGTFTTTQVALTYLPEGVYYVYIFNDADISNFNSFIQYKDGSSYVNFDTDVTHDIGYVDATMQYNRKKCKLTLKKPCTIRQQIRINTASSGHYFAVMITTDGTGYDSIANVPPYSLLNEIYEPYIKHSYPLDSSLTLRGIPKLSDGLYYDGDTYEADGTVTRKYGIRVFDGSETWVARSVQGSYVCQDKSFVPLNVQTQATNRNLISSAYPASTWEKSQSADKVVSLHYYQGLHIHDTSFADVTALKEYLSQHPITVVYELATPTTESAEPYDSIQKVSKYGTEEYVSTGIVPVGHVTKYPTDIVSKVNGLPSDFSTLIAPTETGFKASRAYSVNQFIIVNNQLYRVTSAIANGATITVGTNVVATTVADILTQLLNV